MLSMQKLKLKTCLIKKYGTAKLSKLVPGETVNVGKAPSDKGFKRLVVRKDNSPYCYQVGVDQSKVRKDKKHLFRGTLLPVTMKMMRLSCPPLRKMMERLNPAE